MAVTNVSEMFQQRTARETPRGMTATRTFRVDTNLTTDDGVIVLAAAALPVVGDTHPNNENLLCQDRAANPFNDGTAKYWLVQCAYSDEVEFSENPLQQPPVINWTSEKFQVPAVKDKNGKGVVNSAGDPYDPPAMKDHSRRIVTVKRNVAAVPDWILDYEDAINSDAFIIDGFAVAAEKAKCDKITVGNKQRRGGIPFRELMIEIHLSRVGWKLDVLDIGFRKIDPSDSTKRIDILDPDTGQKLTAPVMLDGSGGELANPSLSNAVFREHDVLRPLPFAALPLV